jgi:hypothetical protein
MKIACRCAALIVGLAGSLFAQTSGAPDLLNRTNELERALRAGEWDVAARLSSELRMAVEDARDNWLAEGTASELNLILTWLPADTMTVVASRWPIRLAKRDASETPNGPDSAFGYALGPLGGVGKGQLLERLYGRTMSMAVLAARGFGVRSPEDQVPPGSGPGALGMIPYQGCGFYSATQPFGDEILAFGMEEVILGRRVQKAKGSQNDLVDATTYYVTLLEPRLLMACNSRKFLEDVLRQSSQTRRPPSPFEGLPDWGSVHRVSRAFAFCRRPLVETMRISPAGVGNLVVEFEKDVVRARMRSQDDPWVEIVSAPDFQGAAKSRKVDSGVWELSSPSGGFSTFLLMALAGFVVLI